MRGGFPGVLEKRAEQATGTCGLVHIAAVGVVEDTQQERRRRETSAWRAVSVVGLGGGEAQRIVRNRTGEDAVDVVATNLELVSSLDFGQSSRELMVVGGLRRVLHALTTTGNIGDIRTR